MELKPGYKLSEAGVIPVDWNARKLGEVITHCTSGATPYRGRPEYYKGDIKWISSGELNYNVIMDTKEKISKEAVEKTNLKIHPVGTLLIAITGLEAAGTRGACGIVGSPATTNQSCMAIYPTSELLTPYLYHYYVYRGNDLAFNYCQGTKQQSYTAKLIKILPIELPSFIEEQAAIAEALSDTDSLIESLEQLIIKKRHLKQGAMQELLRTKKGWLSKRLGSLASLINGRAYSITEWETVGTPVIRLQNLTGRGETYYYSNLNLAEKQYCHSGDLLFMWSATFGPIIWLGPKAIFHYHIWKIECQPKQLSKGYLYYLLSDITEKLKCSSSSGGTMLHLTKSGMEKMEISVPDYDEQERVATILSDMDAEIASLETKLAKTRQLKQGMMHNLLTGRIRLI